MINWKETVKMIYKALLRQLRPFSTMCTDTPGRETELHTVKTVHATLLLKAQFFSLELRPMELPARTKGRDIALQWVSCAAYTSGWPLTLPPSAFDTRSKRIALEHMAQGSLEADVVNDVNYCFGSGAFRCQDHTYCDGSSPHCSGLVLAASCHLISSPVFNRACDVYTPFVWSPEADIFIKIVIIIFSFKINRVLIYSLNLIIKFTNNYNTKRYINLYIRIYKLDNIIYIYT